MELKWRVEDLELELEIQRLVLLVKETTGSCLAFALYTHVAGREAVARELRERLPLPVYEFTLSPERKNPINAIRQWMPDQDGRAALFLYDVEDAFPEALGYLNLQREFFAEIPHAVVLWVRKYGLREIGIKAPDFWAWRSAVFDFRSPEEWAPAAAVQVAVAEPFFYADRGDLERRLSLYLGLLRDYRQEEQPDPLFLAELERKIGLSHYYLGQWSEASEHWHRALEISRRLGDQSGMAKTLNTLGIIDLAEDNFDAARERLGESLAIAERLVDRLQVGYANWGLGGLEEKAGNIKAALIRLGKAEAIFRQLGVPQAESVKQHLERLEQQPNIAGQVEEAD